jgi:hypothetical protein
MFASVSAVRSQFEDRNLGRCDVLLACLLMTQSSHFAGHAHFSNARCKGATPDHIVKLDLHVESAPR